ncbi:3-phosphoshikimate 1-carboxyvinyltransferase [Clostridium gasigenes]|uniref:3-phosphoshikimate 1-carboxyvinyltransferase n=1 Tax=Clostridium gasigenes TaxID=94869 RepID=UPI001C0D30AE|nr:3-phosphoshikimate 1-carboxyvinyltransferase [Clostridium gasigenes]MBU3108820.1 3-phosphoshikimate 1-carboxyvinyltransferase [Clostridium gasigenes]
MGSLKIDSIKLKGEVKIPPSKSMAHRAVICASLSRGVSILENIDYSEDIIATIEGMKTLGAVITKYDDYIEVQGIFNEENKRESLRTINCNESGSTLRFLVPISLLFNGMTRFIGKGNLGRRPLKTYYDIFEKQKINYKAEEGKLNLLVDGKLKSGDFEVEGNISSQFITGLMVTLPLLNGDSKILIKTEVESKGYIDLTIEAMKDFGIEIINNNYKEFIIKGNQSYKPRNYRVEGDYSQAAFFLAADALGSEVILKDLELNSLQGDRLVIEILEKMNVEITATKEGIIGNAKSALKATVIDGSQCPDIIPVLAVVSALSKGTTKIINSSRLRIKECDRLKAITTELIKLGANIKETEDGLIIEGKEDFLGGVEVWSWNDHRIAMSLAIAATRCENPIIINDFECVSKSYPNFFEDYKNLGGGVNEWSLGK